MFHVKLFEFTKFYIYNIQKLAKMNVKKIGFFTFAFFLPSLFPVVAILTGAILQFFQHSIFTPAPYVFHTPPILKNLIPPLIILPLPLLSTPLTTPQNPNPYPQSTPLSIKKQRNFAINHDINTTNQNKSNPQHNKKTLSN